VQLVDYVITHSIAAYKLILKEYGIEQYKNKIIISNHGHYDNYYGEERNKERSRKILKINENSFVIGFIGEIRPYKGLIEFLEIATNLIKQNDEIIIFIAGNCKDNQMKKDIEKIATDQVVLKFGRIKDNELRNHICACDVIAIPYKKYLTSGAAILGMTYKKPIIYADGSLSEIAITNDYRLGWSYGDNGDYLNLETLIQKLIKNIKNTKDEILNFNFDGFLYSQSFENITNNTLKHIFNR
jgi:glycosyltransferase involved in cell wall biosynthesis